MEEKKFETLRYLISYPEKYQPGEKYPVILFLHGAGTRGSDINVLKGNDFFVQTDKLKLPVIRVAPLCEKNSWTDVFETLIRFAEHVSSSDWCDSDRLYLIGNSMGGYGTWQLAMSVPDLFAALIPICGGGMYWNASRLIHIPIWAFHGEQDPCVYPEESKNMVNAVNKKGGHAKLTLYPDTKHNAWTPTLQNPEVFDWLLKQKRQAGHESSDEYNDAKRFG